MSFKRLRIIMKTRIREKGESLPTPLPAFILNEKQSKILFMMIIRSKKLCEFFHLNQTYLRLWSGNLLAKTQYAAFRTDSLTSKVQSIITCKVTLEGGKDSSIVFRTSYQQQDWSWITGIIGTLPHIVKHLVN